jgi:MYXO-CTERM domain-containing protein
MSRLLAAIAFGACLGSIAPASQLVLDGSGGIRPLYQIINRPRPDEIVEKIDRRHPLDIAKSRISSVWTDMPDQLPSATDATKGVVAQPRDEFEEELEQLRSRYRARSADPGQPQGPLRISEMGWLSLVDLGTPDDGDLLEGRSPEPMPEPCSALAVAAGAFFAARRRRR